MKKKQIFSVSLILLFLLPTVIHGDYIPNNEFIKNTWYVDSQGEGDFTNIQQAINNANHGDTIIIKKGIYHESIIINKTLNIQGENKNNTIIQGTGIRDVILITAEHVSISNLSLTKSGKSGRDAGIETNADYTTITNAIIENTTIGIFSYHANYHTISNNILTYSKDYGLHLYESAECLIFNNTITNNRWGILLVYGWGNTLAKNTIMSNKNHGLWMLRGSGFNDISENLIINNGEKGVCLGLFCSNNSFIDNAVNSNKVGISIGLHWACDNNVVYHNNIVNNAKYGFFLSDSTNTIISSNNFQNNKIHAYFKDCNENDWDQNYWGNSTNAIYIIKGKKNLLPWINIDFNPSFNPIEIPTIFLNNDVKQYEAKDNQRIIKTFPPSFIWTNVNGIDYTSPVKNQMPAPTCEAYALCSALETIIHYQVGKNFGSDLSEAHLFFYSGGTAAWGVDATEPAEYLIEFGVPDEGCFPDPHRPYDFPYESINNWERRVVKIKEWGWVNNDIDSIKQAIISYGPLTICQMTRKDLDFYVNGVYMPKVSSPIQRGHVTTIMGYDDSDACWFIRNSGGPEWGEEGYFRMSYEGFDQIYSFIYPFYGGTGIMYIDGIYGNLNPDVPKIEIIKPALYHSYIFDYELKTFLKNINFIQDSVPRIMGNCNVFINTLNTDYIELFIDGTLIDSWISQSNFHTYDLALTNGPHSLEIIAYKNDVLSKDQIDLYVF